MASFHYQDPFPMGADSTEYELLTDQYVSTVMFEGQKMLKVDPAGITLLAQA